VKTNLNAPLAGIRVADFTLHAAGPLCTHLLSQFGAECIKIESKARPDVFRKPHAVYGRMSAATFDQVAANKLSVRLNLKKAEAIEIAKKIVAISDVAAESFRPGVMKRLGLDFDVLKDCKPDIVMLSLSSCGQDGPDSHFAGYAPLFGAWGGLGWMSGYSDGPPVEMRHAMDHSAGLHAAVATMAALHQRRLTGRAQHVDLAAREVASAMIGEALVQANAGQESQRLGNADLHMCPHGVYLTNRPDRWLTLAIRTDAQWRVLQEVIGRECTDPRLATVEGRIANRELVDQLVSDWVRDADADVLTARLQEKGVSAHVSWDMQDVAVDPHLLERQTLMPVSAPGMPDRLVVGSPARFSASPDVGIRRLTPELGQDEEYVFGQLLGMSSAQRTELESREIIL
jgi:crotonobetainyl-CoA:carnitine CoA-transferase CaiB-like acyl-CoA transferase